MNVDHYHPFLYTVHGEDHEMPENHLGKAGGPRRPRRGDREDHDDVWAPQMALGFGP